MSLEEKLEVLLQACRASMHLLSIRPDARKALRYRAPLPESPVELWRRLREEYLEGDHDD